MSFIKLIASIEHFLLPKKCHHMRRSMGQKDNRDKGHGVIRHGITVSIRDAISRKEVRKKDFKEYAPIET